MLPVQLLDKGKIYFVFHGLNDANNFKSVDREGHLIDDIEAYCDDINEYQWFIGLTPRLKDATFNRIGKRGSNPKVIENLISYDRPDAILLVNGVAKLVVEKTREVPTGHNVGQRMARLVRAVELGVPCIKFFPFDGIKHGKYKSLCNLNPRILLAFERMWNIHKSPILAVNWPLAVDGEIDTRETADHELALLVESYIDSNFDPSCKLFVEKRMSQMDEYKSRCEAHKPYLLPPPSLSIVNTVSWLKSVDKLIVYGDTKSLRSKETALYTIEMTEQKCRREDPYTGTQFIYDYIYCRSGVLTNQKSTNFIMHFPLIRKSVWDANNPDEKSRKSSNWYLTANALCFKDTILVLR